MTDWRKNAPKRAANARKALELVAKTASKSYDVPPEEAAELIRGLEAALDAVRSAYEPHLGGLDIGGRAEAAPRAEPPPAPRAAPLSRSVHILQIGAFVDALPMEHLPSYLTHIGNRLSEAAEALWSDRLESIRSDPAAFLRKERKRTGTGK